MHLRACGPSSSAQGQKPDDWITSNRGKLCTGTPFLQVELYDLSI